MGYHFGTWNSDNRANVTLRRLAAIALEEKDEKVQAIEFEGSKQFLAYKISNEVKSLVFHDVSFLSRSHINEMKKWLRETKFTSAGKVRRVKEVMEYEGELEIWI